MSQMGVLDFLEKSRAFRLSDGCATACLLRDLTSATTHPCATYGPVTLVGRDRSLPHRGARIDQTLVVAITCPYVDPTHFEQNMLESIVVASVLVWVPGKVWVQ